MNEKVLITGASGFIGSNLLRRLVGESYKVTVFLRNTSDIWRIRDLTKKIDIVYADLSDYPSLKKKIKEINPKYVFHLATYGSYPDVQKNENLMIQTNIIETYNLLKATNDINYKCFVHTGSSSEYGIKETALCESDLTEPLNPYGVTKCCATLFCRMFSKLYNKNIVVLRPFSVYGPYEEKCRLVPYLVINCLENKEVKLTHGEQKRDFIFVEDLIEMYLKVMKRNDLAGEILNVGTGVDYCVKDVARLIFKLTNQDKDLLKIGAKKMRKLEAMKSWKADTSKIRRLLKYKPNYDLEGGMKKTIEWFKKNMELYKDGN